MEILKEKHDDVIKTVNMENEKKIKSIEEEQSLLSITFFFTMTNIVCERKGKNNVILYSLSILFTILHILDDGDLLNYVLII